MNALRKKSAICGARTRACSVCTRADTLSPMPTSVSMSGDAARKSVFGPERRARIGMKTQDLPAAGSWVFEGVFEGAGATRPSQPLEGETQASAHATRILYQQNALAADGVHRQIPLRQHITDIGGGLHMAPEARDGLANVNVETGQRLHGIGSA